jgi:RNA polymerase sigma-32 factor
MPYLSIASATARSATLTPLLKRDRPASVNRTPKPSPSTKPPKGAELAKRARSAATEPANARTEGNEHEEEEEDTGERNGEGEDVGDGDPAEGAFVDVDAKDDEATDDSLPQASPLSRVGAGSSMERLDPMAAYLREVQRHPLLTPERTHELATQFVKTQDPAIAAQLVTANLRLVVKIAYEYRRAYKNIMDLVQEGNIGLMQAVKRYDPYRGVKLSSYAAWWIRAYILRFILNNWRLVKLGTTQAQRKLFFNLRKKRAELQALGVDPTHAEIARQLNVPESDVAEMDVRLAQSEKSLDAPVGDSDGRSIARVDMMPFAGAGPEALMAGEEMQSLLKLKLGAFRKTLDEKSKDVAIFDLRLVAEDPLTLQDLGDRFGVSRERVRQLEQRLLARLRDYLKREMGDATDTLE